MPRIAHFVNSPFRETAITLENVAPLVQVHIFRCVSHHFNGSQDIQKLLHSTRSTFDLERLSVISISSLSRQDHTDIEPSPVIIFPLKQLLSYKNIEQRFISVRVPFSLDDADIIALADAFPKLRTIHFSGYDRLDTYKKPSLRGLAKLWHGCPLIEHVPLIIDATVRHPLPPALSGRSRKVTMINFGCSHIEDPSYVASFLNLLFPTLRKVKEWNDGKLDPGVNATFSTRWAQVNSFWTVLHAKERYSREWSAIEA